MSQKNEFAISMIPHGGIGVTDEKGETIRNLTGSCHELAIQYHDTLLRILVDVGGYQGTGVIERDMKKIARGVSTIVLTHPHMDHIGELATLYHGEESEHFRGKVIATPGTKMATRAALLDGAKILKDRYERALIGQKGSLIKEIETAKKLVENYEKRNKGVSPIAKSRKGRSGQSGEICGNVRYEQALGFLEPYREFLGHQNWKDIILPKPSYTNEDVERACGQIKELAISQREKEILEGKVFVSFYNAGHIIGSACALFKILDEKRKPHYVLFTGDVGSYKWDLHINGLPEPPNNLFLDAVVIESTYGGKVREPFEKGRKEFEDSLINSFKDVPDTSEKKGRKAYKQVIHACFSLDRLQNILFRVIALKKSGRLSEDTKIYVDSPLGLAYIHAYLDEAKRTLKNLKRPKQSSITNAVGNDYVERETKLLEEFIECLSLRNRYFVSVNDDDTREDLLREPEEKRIIITASGMANGGPVMAYLGAFAEDPSSAFYFPGYLAEGTLGQQLAGAVQTKSVEINGTKKSVRARMKNFTFLSGHGDEEDLIRFLESLKFRKDSKIVVVHGDKDSSSTALAHTITRQLGIDAEQIRVPDIEEEIQVWGDGIKKHQEKEKSTSKIETLIQELEIALQTQDALLTEKMKEVNERKSIASKNDKSGSWVTENENATNLAREIMMLLQDITTIPGIIEKLRGLKSDEEISKDLTEEIKKYRHDITVSVSSEDEPTVTSTPKIQIKRVAISDKTATILSELPKEEPQESKYLPKLQEIIQGHNEANSRLIEEVRNTVSGPVLARFQTAINLVKELRNLYDTIAADQETLTAMKKAQERRAIDDIPVTDGKEVDRRKVSRRSRLKNTQNSYENASSIAIETLEERLSENTGKAEKHRIFLREYVGIFNNPEQIGTFLATGRISNKKGTRTNKDIINKRLQEQQPNLEQAQEAQLQVQETIKQKYELLSKLEEDRQETENILKHVPEHIDALLQSLKKRLFGIRKKLSTAREVDDELSRLEGDIVDVTIELRDIPSIITKLEELGVIYLSGKQNAHESTIAIYSRKKIEIENTIAKFRKPLGEPKGNPKKVTLSEEQKLAKEKRIADIEMKIFPLKQELDRVNTILALLPEGLSAHYDRLEKSRKELLRKKEQLIKDGLDSDALLSLENEANGLEQMIPLLSGKLQEPAKLIAFLEKLGISYIPNEGPGKKTQEKPQDEMEKPPEPTYTTYKKLLQSTDRQLAQLRDEIARLERDAKQIQLDIDATLRNKGKLEALLDGTGEDVHASIDEDESFWLPHVSGTEINQGIYLAISEVLEKMAEYKEFKQNLSKIRGMNISDSSMTEKEFIGKAAELDKLAKENEVLRPLIITKLKQHFSTDRK